MNKQDLYANPIMLDALKMAAAKWKQRQQNAQQVSTLPIPRSRDELAHVVYDIAGIRLSPNAVCPGHSAPLQAFADAFFAKHSMAVWKGCIPDDGIILTRYETKRAVDVAVGDEVLGFDGAAPTWGAVTEKRCSGVQEILRIRTNSADLRVTENHRVLVMRKVSHPRAGSGGYKATQWEYTWVHARDIVKGDHLVQPFGLDHAEGGDIDLAELCGILIGDGGVNERDVWLSHAPTATYAQHYYDVAERLFGKRFSYHESNMTAYLSSTIAAARVRAAGVVGDAYTKRVPQWVMCGTRDEKLAFLRGYLDADGTVRSTGEVEWSSVSEMLLHDVRALCLSLGLAVGRVTRTKISAMSQLVMGRVVRRAQGYTLRCYHPEFGSHDSRYIFANLDKRTRDESNPYRQCEAPSSASQLRYLRVLDIAREAAQCTWDFAVSGVETFTCDTFIVHNSRGLGGKTTMLALLGHVEMVLLGADVVILGGSGQQSQRVHEAQDRFWKYPKAPRGLLARDPTQYETDLTNGGHTVALMASTRSVRGPHPQRLRLDEVDEMTLQIFDSAMGQTMEANGVLPQTVMSSTHQYADGTMSEILKRASQRGWPVYEWCVAKDTLVSTPRGQRRIDSLRAGDVVHAYDERRMVYVQTRISAAWSNGVKRTLRIVTDNGTIECTPEHKLLTDNGWKEAQELRPGSKVQTVWGSLFARESHTDVSPMLHRERSCPDSTYMSVRESFATRCRALSRLLSQSRRENSLRVRSTQTSSIENMPRLLSQAIRRIRYSRTKHAHVGARDWARSGSTFVVGSQGRATVERAGTKVQNEQSGRAIRLRLLPPRLQRNSGGVRWFASRRTRIDARQGTSACYQGERVRIRRVVGPRYAHVVEVAVGRTVDVWDISVPQYHSFVANGLVAHNCYKENLEENGGWLPAREVERKRNEVTKAMWDAEYDLQEPSLEGRAIDTKAVEAMFDPTLGEFAGALGVEETYEAPTRVGEYATGADWAKNVDFTISVTVRSDVYPMRWVAFKRDGRRPWPLMIGDYNERVKRYAGSAMHDETGLGTVVADLLDVDAKGMQLVGRARTELLNEYVAAIERGELIAPRTNWAYSEHRYATLNDLYGTGHLPDSICAGALAYRAAKLGAGSMW